EDVDLRVEESYKGRIALAKEAAAAKTDKDIREVMRKDDEAVFMDKPTDAISDDDVAKYRLKQLPVLQKFAAGSPSRTQYETQIRQKIEGEESGYEFHLIGTIIWVAAGV